MIPIDAYNWAFTPYFLKESLAEQVGEQQDGCNVRIFFTVTSIILAVYCRC